jgi:hypothetical protein
MSRFAKHVSPVTFHDKLLIYIGLLPFGEVDTVSPLSTLTGRDPPVSGSTRLAMLAATCQPL